MNDDEFLVLLLRGNSIFSYAQQCLRLYRGISANADRKTGKFDTFLTIIDSIDGIIYCIFVSVNILIATTEQETVLRPLTLGLFLHIVESCVESI